VCGTNGGEVRGLGVGVKGKWEKCQNVDVFVGKLGEENFENEKLSLLEDFELLPLEVDIRAISNVVFFAPLSISSILRIFISIREKFGFSNNEMPFLGVGGGGKKNISV
jgi:hypothetical protein